MVLLVSFLSALKVQFSPMLIGFFSLVYIKIPPKFSLPLFEEGSIRDCRLQKELFYLANFSDLPPLGARILEGCRDFPSPSPERACVILLAFY